MIIKRIPLILAVALSVACTEQRQEFLATSEADDAPLVTVQLGASTSTTMASRAIDNSTTWTPESAVLFEFRDDTLRWCRTVAHPDLDILDGQITITDNETDRPVELVMLANVDTAKITTAMRISGKGKEEVTKEINTAWNYNVRNAIDAMPLAGELTLPHFWPETTTGNIPLRRALAQISLQLEFTGQREYTYDLEEVIVVNVPDAATLYNPSTDTPRTPNVDGLTNNLLNWTNNTLCATISDDASSATLLIPEAANSEENGKQISVLFKATRRWQESNKTDSTYCYRLDLKMEEYSDTISMDVLRNHHYNFFLLNLGFDGAESYDDCMKMTTAHNMRKQYEYPGKMVFILDEDIMSITANILDENHEGFVPEFIGVSSASIELSEALGVTRFTLHTNIEDFHVMEVPGYEGILDFQYGDPEETTVTAYYYDNDNKLIEYNYTAYTETIWVWLEDYSAVSIGDTYIFYIYGGNILKTITLTITD